MCINCDGRLFKIVGNVLVDIENEPHIVECGHMVCEKCGEIYIDSDQMMVLLGCYKKNVNKEKVDD